jgi:hypothetical protein
MKLFTFWAHTSRSNTIYSFFPSHWWFPIYRIVSLYLCWTSYVLSIFTGHEEDFRCSEQNLHVFFTSPMCALYLTYPPWSDQITFSPKNKLLRSSHCFLRPATSSLSALFLIYILSLRRETNSLQPHKMLMKAFFIKNSFPHFKLTQILFNNYAPMKEAI